MLLEKNLKALDALKLLCPDSSDRTVKNWLKAGRLFSDEKLIRHPEYLLSKGSKVSLLPPRSYLRSGIEILFEDRYFIIIEKPIGLLSVPAGGKPKPNARQILYEYLLHPVYAVHRLDREASGILIFAKTKDYRFKMSKLFERKEICRKYHAVVEGSLKKEKGTWKSYLVEESITHVKSTKSKGALAITHYKVLSSGKTAHIECQLETGKRHQIRVHCLEASHPILGDIRYGSQINPINRLCLHAKYMQFIHPYTNKKITIHCPPPIAMLTI